MECKQTILIIEHQSHELAEIAKILSSAGYRCHGAQNAAAAREAVQQAEPALIIADVSMSGKSGPALCEQLKHEAGLGEVPVMFLSAAQVPDIIRRSHAAGGTYYLRKPFDGPVLVQIVEKAILAPHLSTA